MIKDIKPTSLQRKCRSLQKALEAQHELRESQTHQHSKYREHAAAQLAQHLARIRELSNQVDDLKDHAIKDAFRLNDYRDQIAIQQRMVAEAKDDATRAVRDRDGLIRSVKGLQQESEHLSQARDEWCEEYTRIRDKTPLWEIAWGRFARWANG